MKRVLFPPQSRLSLVVATVLGFCLGVFATLLGVVSRTGGIDGGGQGLVVSLLCLGLGSAMFVTFAGIIPWFGYAIGILAVLLALPRLAASGDRIDTMYTDAISTWNMWLPVAVFGGFLIAVAVLMIGGRRSSQDIVSEEPSKLGHNSLEVEK